jgi:fatty acid desaturase
MLEDQGDPLPQRNHSGAAARQVIAQIIASIHGLLPCISTTTTTTTSPPIAAIASIRHLAAEYKALLATPPNQRSPPPVSYAGSVLGIVTNYYQHGGGSAGRSRPDAVSHYGALYNWLCCNEGYHREHHRQPGVHWTARPALREPRR